MSSMNNPIIRQGISQTVSSFSRRLFFTLSYCLVVFESSYFCVQPYTFGTTNVEVMVHIVCLLFCYNFLMFKC